jgi:hypothetical protein
METLYRKQIIRTSFGERRTAANSRLAENAAKKDCAYA